MRHQALTFAVLAALSTSPVAAQAPGDAATAPSPAPKASPPPDAKAVAETPAVVAAFRPAFRPGTKRDKVKDTLAPVVADLFGGRDEMTEATIAAYGKRLAAAVRAQRLAAVMAADLDGDGKVTRREIEDYLGARPGMTKEQAAQAAAKVFAMSRDGASITFDDLRTAPLPDVTANAAVRMGKAVLGDAKSVNRAGFERAALGAFDAVDTNRDGTVELDEFLAGQARPALKPGTPMPSAKSGGSPSFAPATPPSGKP